MAPLLTTLTGFGFGITLIVVIGAQNAYVLRQGLRREHVAIVVGICAASDALLIIAGVGGLGAIIDAAPRALDVMRVVGAVFLLGYAFVAVRRAMHPQVLDPASDAGPVITARRAATTALALTWLNPHVYLDTVLLLGSVARSHEADRWWFGFGAMVGSVVWFSALGFGARLLQPLFARPLAWRVLDTFIAALMVIIATTLLREV
ncbi:MAG: LysE/ArgO family amino acid transporter [Aeromicrobium sp.]|uniref:LysE/ArgO family amino acid transporter n=1 Tax=Aeromicrobium sp. TaxID=1871063 RepID=UPI003C58CC59